MLELASWVVLEMKMARALELEMEKVVSTARSNGSARLREKSPRLSQTEPVQ